MWWGTLKGCISQKDDEETLKQNMKVEYVCAASSLTLQFSVRSILVKMSEIHFFLIPVCWK